ncbi:MAG: hypothetical protein JST17_14340 [Bacteroidetes bacterium]|mgnify:CR=1 FL=1|nr:hypothetical protein [Bacteroidota bacterium]MBS1930668.1 hypothetical protein [Bacteroidota bacterium]
MKPGMLLITLLINCFFAFSQTSNDPLGHRNIIDQASRNILYTYQFEDVKGSPFLSDNWQPGILIYKNHSVFKNVKLKFDIKANEFIFNRNDSSFQLDANVTEVRLYPKQGDSLIFKNGYGFDKSLKPTKYLQVLAEGKITFLKFIKKDIEEYNEYGDATKYKRFIDMYDYYIVKDSKTEDIHLSKKTLQTLLADKWDKISDYLSQYKLSGKDEKSFIAAIRYYNSSGAF